jgi:trehalose synthase
MTAQLDAYAPYVGQATIDELRVLGTQLGGRSIQHVNSTAVGGGVAEILSRLVPLTRELGIDVRWDVIKGGEGFFALTKRLHNGLHGGPFTITPEDQEIFRETTEENLRTLALGEDAVFIHDPQPVALVQRIPNRRRAVWRCHIDVSQPAPDAWGFIRPWVEQYAAMVVSEPEFVRDVDVEQFLVAPSIDPLSDKNRELEPELVRQVTERHGLDPSRPIVTQVSRFDRLKDPLGVIEAFLSARRYNDCQLLLVGGGATDDPEGHQVLAECRERAASSPDIHVLELPPDAHLEINALQRASSVIIQKSLREGFGLTVTEALWKAKPVIATATGGIPLQITHKYSGVLTHSIEGTAYWLKQLLNAPEYAKWLGQNGREHVRHNFLLIRQLRDYLVLALSLDHPRETLIRLG